MSTPSSIPQAYLEFPNFGYGPAAALLVLIQPMVNDYEWHILSTGGAAQFARKHLPAAVVHDLDTFRPQDWPRCLDHVPAGSVLISATNPHFAGWAAQQGYKVGIVDTLDWMWDVQPPGVDQVEFHLVQHYFGTRSADPATQGRRQLIRPIVDRALWTSDRKTRHGTAVIGFGGMAVPGRAKGTANYVEWLLSAVLPLLVDSGACSQVDIVGAREDLHLLVPSLWTGHLGIRVHTGLDRASYAALARTAEHLILAPGLATINECAVAGLTPLIQPGFNMSMVLEAHDLVETGYPHVAAWPWLDKAASQLSGMAELDGLHYLAGLIDDTVRTDSPETCGITKALVSYLSRVTEEQLRLPDDSELPDGQQLLAEHVRALI